MGHEIEKVAKDKGLNIVSTVDPSVSDAKFKEISEESMKGVDVCLDFTHPESVIGNIEKIAKFSVPHLRPSSICRCDTIATTREPQPLHPIVLATIS